MPSVKSNLVAADDANSRSVLDVIYLLEDAKLIATQAGEKTLRYFVEIALLHARKIAGCSDKSSSVKID